MSPQDYQAAGECSGESRLVRWLGVVDRVASPSEVGVDSDGPSDEEYGRTTNLERFAVLHVEIAELIERLEDQHDVRRSVLADPSFPVSMQDRSQPVVRLTPEKVNAAPIEVVRTTFPGLYLRFGRSTIEGFPTCGCDGCAESGEGEVERVSWRIDQVVRGRFKEYRKSGFAIWDLEGNSVSSVVSRRRRAEHYAPW
ncbi:MAG: DUF6226 family protein [Actinomycetota bacterium]